VGGLIVGSQARLRGATAPSIVSIEPRGVLIPDCGLPGETRADDVVPAHPNGIPVSRNRWLLVYATRGFRGVDDDLSIVYQLRAGTLEGRLIKEGAFARTQSDWDPLGNGDTRHVKQHGHPVAFGVPRGARIGGQPAPSANVFVVKWRKVARDYDPVRRYLSPSANDLDIETRTQAVEWAQFRLNSAEDDIEIVQPPERLRQKGYESGPQICAAPIKYINETFVQAVPFNRERTEWADCCHFDGGRVACLKYTFNAALGRYEWTHLGPFMGGDRNAPTIVASGGKAGVMEASLVPWRDGWIIAARGGPRGGATWFRTEDPFGAPAPRGISPAAPHITCPLTAYAWPDGGLRLFSGDAKVSPYRNSRNPLYCWDIDPDRGFAASSRRIIFDTVAAGLPFSPAASPKVDMCKLLPSEGSTQAIVYRVSIRAYNHPYPGSPDIPRATAREKAACAIYYSRITYAGPTPPAWEFAAL